MLGALIATASAATFGLSNAAVRRGVLTGSVAQAITITVPIGLIMFAVAVVVSGAWTTFGAFKVPSFALLAVAGVLHFTFGRYCNYRAIKAMGSGLSAPVMQVGLLWTLFLAVVVLGEPLTPTKATGILMLLLAPLLALGRRAKAPPASRLFEPDYRQGYVFALLAAFGTGTSPIMIKHAMSGMGGLHAGIAGGAISYLAATLVVVLLLALPGKLRQVSALTRREAALFLLTGLLVNLSQLFRYMALAIAPVSLVAPLQRTSIIFRLYFGWLFNREHEVLTVHVLTASVLSLIGAILVTMG